MDSQPRHLMDVTFMESDYGPRTYSPQIRAAHESTVSPNRRCNAPNSFMGKLHMSFHPRFGLAVAWGIRSQRRQDDEDVKDTLLNRSTGKALGKALCHPTHTTPDRKFVKDMCAPSRIPRIPIKNGRQE